MFTGFGIGDDPYVATSEREVGDVVHLAPAEGWHPHSVKLEVFAFELDRVARRLRLALGHHLAPCRPEPKTSAGLGGGKSNPGN